MTFKGLSVKSPVNNFMGDTVTVPFISSPDSYHRRVTRSESSAFKFQLLRAVGFMGSLSTPSTINVATVKSRAMS